MVTGGFRLTALDLSKKVTPEQVSCSTRPIFHLLGAPESSFLFGFRYQGELSRNERQEDTEPRKPAKTPLPFLPVV